MVQITESGNFYRTNIIFHDKASLIFYELENMTGAITTKLKKINYWLAGAAIMMVLVGSVYSHAQGKNHIPGFGDTANINDDTFLQGVKNVTKSVPKNETLVVTGDTAVIQYFTDHPVKLPWKGKVKSEKTLATWMSNLKYNYLLVVYTHGKGSSTLELQPIFSNKGLRALTPDFQKIRETKTESAKLLLYKRI